MGLKGANVLVTRPEHQAENLSQLIMGQGGRPVRLPTLAISAIADFGKIPDVLATLDKYQWLVFVSANAVNFAVQANGGKIAIHLTLIAAMGRATASALRQAGMAVDLLPPPPFNSEALLATAQMQDIGGQRFLIVRGEGGREQLAEGLRLRGAEVDYLEVYRRVMPTPDCTEVLDLLRNDKLATVTATSGEAIQNLMALIERDLHPKLLALPLVVVGERLATIAAQVGFKRIAVAEEASDTAIIKTMTKTLSGEAE